ncbi:MAG: Fic family protein [Alphaproteobacteria bacterium CG_4_10_14_0_2_um_filter_63_37]|nr:MAG: cell filamentation protein Fic [Proteobacteria bacterium CG1_02_64_396]PJA24300.1 MAG: Fic family protein [Alphaproteobacteria bacterium CG_4_10_14_0_2_um_filter_63_37]
MAEFFRRVDTQRFGPFDLQLGVDAAALETLLLRVEDAHARFRSSPLAQVATRLEREVVVSSIFGTNSIEGAALSEAETEQALLLDPEQIQGIEQRRALNLKAAYTYAQEQAAQPTWQPDAAFVGHVHALITDQLPHEHNRPGLLRNNPKEVATYVGDATHGGRYKPPQYGGDVRLLLDALMVWQRELAEAGVSVLLRAPLTHLYFELIHPFWDGNGRVGRVLEATLLHTAGYRYAPFAQARYYYDQIDRYFALFNQCRKQSAAKNPAPNTPFVHFFLEGMLVGINALHDRVNRLIHVLLFENDLKRLRDDKTLNARQYAIATQVLEAGAPIPLGELRKKPWYLALYPKLTDKTKQRDLGQLRGLGLIVVAADNRVWPGCFNPE